MKQNTLSDNQHPVVLIVEDNEDIMTYIVDSFTDLYEVKTARNGKEGMEIALESIPDLIVSDIMMPIMDGITMCRKLKKRHTDQPYPYHFTYCQGHTDRQRRRISVGG